MDGVNLIAGVLEELAKTIFDVYEFRIGGEVALGESIGVEVFFSIKVFTFTIQGGLKLNLNNLLLDFCNKIVQYVFCGKPNARYGCPAQSIDDDFYANEEEFSDDEGTETLSRRQTKSVLPDLPNIQLKLTPEEKEKLKEEMKKL